MFNKYRHVQNSTRNINRNINKRNIHAFSVNVSLLFFYEFLFRFVFEIRRKEKGEEKGLTIVGI